MIIYFTDLAGPPVFVYVLMSLYYNTFDIYMYFLNLSLFMMSILYCGYVYERFYQNRYIMTKREYIITKSNTEYTLCKIFDDIEKLNNSSIISEEDDMGIISELS